MTEEDAVAEPSLSGQPADPFGERRPRQFDDDGLPGAGNDLPAAQAEAVGGELVAVTADMEGDLPAHQPRLLEGQPAEVVGDEAEPVDRLEFDQRYPPPGRRIDDPNLGPGRSALRRRSLRLHAPRRRGAGQGGADEHTTDEGGQGDPRCFHAGAPVALDSMFHDEPRAPTIRFPRDDGP